MLLEDVLLRAGKVSPEDLEIARKKIADTGSNSSVASLLLDEGIIDESDFLDAQAEHFSVPLIDRVKDEWIDPLLVRDLPVEWARSHHMLPIRYEGKVAVLTRHPGAVEAQDDLSLLLGEEVVPVLASDAEISRCIERCYYSREETAEAFLSDLKPSDEAGLDLKSEASDLLRHAGEAPVTQLVNLILLEAVKAGASDVHVEPFEKNIRIRQRIDGLLYDQASPPKHMESALVSRLKVMGRLDIAEKRLPQDGMAKVRVGEQEIDIRVSTVPVAAGERVVLRLLNKNATLLPLNSLGMAAEMIERFRQVIANPYGAVWVTGPTGSGKTTTLYAALRELDAEHRNIMTIEEPIEYQISNIGQIAVKPKIGLTFAQGLRHILRQDPDVILVGETRDLETAEIAVRASLTGHVVLSTLHTNDAASAIVRLIDMGIPPYLLSSATTATMAQRLLRKLCPVCRRPSVLTSEERKAFGRLAREMEDITVWRETGCEKCRGGFSGRVGVFEMLILDPEMRELIRRDPNTAALNQLRRKNDDSSLLKDAMNKMTSGVTSVSEVLRVVSSLDQPEQ